MPANVKHFSSDLFPSYDSDFILISRSAETLFTPIRSFSPSSKVFCSPALGNDHWLRLVQHLSEPMLAIDCILEQSRSRPSTRKIGNRPENNQVRAGSDILRSVTWLNLWRRILPQLNCEARGMSMGEDILIILLIKFLFPNRRHMGWEKTTSDGGICMRLNRCQSPD